MPDSIALHVANRRLDKFVSYHVQADLYCADNYFRIDLHDPGFEIPEAARCQLSINGIPALTGIIDLIADADDKRGTQLAIEGRDLMGLLVDSYVETFVDEENMPLKELAETLLATVPFINRNNVRYQAGLAGARANAVSSRAADPLAALMAGQKNTHIEPGATVFEVLKRAAMSRGAMFYGLPDGTFVFGRPKAAGAALFSVTHRTDGRGNNAFRSTRVRNTSRRYSKIVVVGQQQGDDLLGAEQINVQATVSDPQAPFYKPLVALLNDDAVSPAQYARMLLEIQRSEALQLVYSVRGHSQAGRNWTINELCRVRDGRRNIDGTYLVVSRAFSLSKADGPVTEIRLGLPGVMA
ncbi:MAG: hypothetical protein VR64_20610 [Desulfatitalea sp. BRH_c12]|nr:MAG: hypothetical protein VR64_20610 [Desulfatitalea sp. BRH_c12]